MSKSRIAIGALSLSAAAFVGILTREGYTETAIIPTKGDVATVGFGTTSGVKLGDRTTPVAAAQRAYKDVAQYEGAVKRCVTAPLTQVEYDVYIDLSYNIGPTRFCNSSIPQKLSAGQYEDACRTILQYKYSAGYDCSTPGNKRCAGVWTDRQAKYKACMEAQ